MEYHVLYNDNATPPPYNIRARAPKPNVGEYHVTHNIYRKEERMCETTVTVGFWNILAEGLSAGEFMSPTDGENVALWANRGPRIVEAMSNMFAKGCALIGVVENDKPRYLLAELKKKHPKIACVHVIKGEYQKTNAFKINTKNTAGRQEE